VTFGQQSGPPASAKQLSYLLSLVKQAGYAGFRDARHPLGLTQRQAGGRFTSREASALIARLLGDEDGDGGAGGEAAPASQQRAAAAEERLAAERAEVARGLPADVLATELERRGWSVAPPASG
jgi:hypothetical protein